MLLVLSLIACDPPAPSAGTASAPTPPAAKRTDRDPGPTEQIRDARTRVFFVSDTLRADHTSVCGYGQPTTPTLESLKAEGAEVRCQAISTGSWTHPGHAGMLTGLSFWDHGAYRASEVVGDCKAQAGQQLVAALKHRTALHELADQGWRTVCVVENTIVSDVFGTTSGCQVVVETHKWAEDWDADDGTIAWVRRELSKDDPRPVALFVNVMDAHQPYRTIPADHPFLEAATPFPESEEWTSFQDPKTQATAVRLYDHGVWRADQKLGQVLEAVRSTRKGPLQLVFSSDHGEMLGEDGGIVAHSNGVWPGLLEVPLVTLGFDVELPEGPFSSALVYGILLEQELAGPPPQAASERDQGLWDEFGWGVETEVAVYEGQRRVHCVASGCTDSSGPVVEPDYQALVTAVTDTIDCAALDGNAERLEQMRALGYIE